MARWVESKYRLNGYRAIELDQPFDDVSGQREISAVGRNGELYGYRMGRKISDFRGVLVWEHRTATRVAKVLGKTNRGAAPVFSFGEELMAEVPVEKLGEVMALLGLDLIASPKVLAEIMNNIRGRLYDLPSRIDELAGLRARSA